MNVLFYNKKNLTWGFRSEIDLETFIWENLDQLFHLTPLSRQHHVAGQYCDILALRNNKQLVILELKNAEDRYIVQQLTRYYHVLQEEKVFADQIDYNQSIELIALVPNFHNDNLIDRLYNKLKIRFIEFSIFKNSDQYFLVLKDFDSQKIIEIQIPYQEEKDNSEKIPDSPRSLINRIAKYQSFSESARENLFKIRTKILTFDKRIKENVNGNRILYGKGKTNQCAEFYFTNSDIYKDEPNLFLRLPDPDPWRKKCKIKRMHIRMNKNWDKFISMNYYPRAFISSKNEIGGFYNYPNFINRIQKFSSEDVSNDCYKHYQKIIESGTNDLMLLVEIALENWLQR